MLWVSCRSSHASFSERPLRTSRSTPTKYGCKVFIMGKSERSEWSGRTRRPFTAKTSAASGTVWRSLVALRRRASGTVARARPATCAGKFWESRMRASSGVGEDLILAVAWRPMSLTSHAFNILSVSRSTSNCSFRAQRRERTVPSCRFRSTWKRRPSSSSSPSSSLLSSCCRRPSSSPSPPSVSPPFASSASPSLSFSFSSSGCVLYSLLLIASSKPYPVRASAPGPPAAGGPSACLKMARQGEVSGSASSSRSSGPRLGRPSRLTAP
mmetsp:Transcript_128666/g.358218  ORF Transcript_128666/g.358218 Transcript_128666/m.358218 type:complete len:269 (-) Transcript_128666:150-956(-)